MKKSKPQVHSLKGTGSLFRGFPEGSSPRRSRGNPIFLVFAAHDDLERIIRQWPLQHLRFIPRRTHPDIALLIGGQDHRHRLVMDRRDDRVQRGCQEAVDLMRPRNRLRLGATLKPVA